MEACALNNLLSCHTEYDISTKAKDVVMIKNENYVRIMKPYGRITENMEG